MPFTESCRKTAIANEPLVRGLGWCYAHRKWCGADIDLNASLTDEAKAELAEAHSKSIADAIASRRFSTQLLAWARDPELMGTVPNDGLMAGVLVDLCTRMNEMEANLGAAVDLIDDAQKREVSEIEHASATVAEAITRTLASTDNLT